jgi:hypothetical protein
MDRSIDTVHKSDDYRSIFTMKNESNDNEEKQFSCQRVKIVVVQLFLIFLLIKQQ